MKTKQLLLSLLVLLMSLPVLAQSTIGLPVQGIARDANGTARINETINLIFELYYVENNNENFLFAQPQTESITTDAFGVFSSVVETVGRRSVFNSKAVFLRISENVSGTIVVISDEQLNSVPYAIAADNGVPTGAIMPYIGTVAPDGWLLCDGAVIPTGEQYQALRDLHGNNTPNLGGMFLRGVGSNAFSSQNTVLNGIQDDQNLSHNHGVTVTMSGAGAHSHKRNLARTNAVPQTQGGGGDAAVVNLDNEFDSRNTNTTSVGSHTHNLSASSSNNGGNETRPINYGVNYIIKL